MDPLAGIQQHNADIQSVEAQMPQRIPMPPVRRPVQPNPQATTPTSGGFDSVGLLLNKLMQKTRKIRPVPPKVKQFPNPMAQQTGKPTSSFLQTQRGAIERALMAHFDTIQ